MRERSMPLGYIVVRRSIIDLRQDPPEPPITPARQVRFELHSQYLTTVGQEMQVNTLPVRADRHIDKLE